MSDSTKSKPDNKWWTPFTFDFESLYDKLSPDLVFEALHEAMDFAGNIGPRDSKTGLLG